MPSATIQSPGQSYTGAASRKLTAGPDWLLLTAVIAVVGALVRVAWFTPVERMQGAAQKIFYLHVPAAFIGLYFACGLVAVSSLVYLWLRDERLDLVAESAAEVAFLFLSVVLVTGPIWGKPVWGTWWSWDARLTLSLFLWFVLLGYMLLRSALEDRSMRARFSAVMGVLAALLVPFIHMSVYLFRTLHPRPIILKPERPSLPDEMLITFLLSFVAFILLFAALLRRRYRYAVWREELVAREEELA
jgi:heme exporter protein C